MEELKTKLLDTNLFIDNEWLDKYVDLVLNNEVKQEKFKTQKHHILQVAYFTHYNLPIDNSGKNLINLLYKDHILAHYYLMKCTTDWLKWANQSSFWQMIGRRNIDGLDSVLASLDSLQEDYEDFCKANSINNSGERNGNYGHFWTKEQREIASIKAKEKAKDPAYRKIISDRFRKYYENHHCPTKGKKAYYSLAEEKIVYRSECPEGYTDKPPQWYFDMHLHTYFKQGNKVTQGFTWYTNGTDNKFCLPENKPEGYYKGRVSNAPGSLRNRKAYHNSKGKVIYLFDTDLVPEGFIQGGLWKGDNRGSKNPSYGRHWYTNGEINIHDSVNLEDCPKGFRKGQTRGCKNYKLKDILGE